MKLHPKSNDYYLSNYFVFDFKYFPLCMNFLHYSNPKVIDLTFSYPKQVMPFPIKNLTKKIEEDSDYSFS